MASDFGTNLFRQRIKERWLAWMSCWSFLQEVKRFEMTTKFMCRNFPSFPRFIPNKSEITTKIWHLLIVTQAYEIRAITTWPARNMNHERRYVKLQTNVKKGNESSDDISVLLKHQPELISREGNKDMHGNITESGIGTFMMVPVGQLSTYPRTEVIVALRYDGKETRQKKYLAQPSHR